jgi:GNAT superfamily N-acetyltransferase
MLSIRRIELPVDGFEALAEDARADGYHMIERLQNEWAEGRNRFSGEAEALLGAFVDEQLVGVGGVHHQPLAGLPEAGRLRRVYVRPAWRRRGIGEALISELLQRARTRFSEVRLRTDNPNAARVYERMGFTPFVTDHSSHRLFLDGITANR